MPGTTINDFMLYTLLYINNEDLQVVSQTTVLKFYLTKIVCVWWWSEDEGSSQIECLLSFQHKNETDKVIL